jgi:hypothetical protein
MPTPPPEGAFEMRQFAEFRVENFAQNSLLCREAAEFAR